ncbi:MAG: cytochrome c3 family protein [Planctomycetota bacterium]
MGSGTERLRGSSDVRRKPARRGRFSLANLDLRIVALVVLLSFGLLAYNKAAVPSPGPISAVHAGEEALASMLSCVHCHDTPTGNMSRACKVCHEEIGQQLDGKSGFHASIRTVSAAECSHCHHEHAGRDSRLVDEDSFRAAGFEKREDYKHDGLGFELMGRHLELDCDKCHERALVRQLKKNEQRFLGQTQKCWTCHKDPHEGKLDECASCHGQEKAFEFVAEFEHDERFPLVGGHEEVACTSCHQKGTVDSVEDIVESAKAGKPGTREIRECVICHEIPHSERFISGVARELAMSQAKTCSECHDYRRGGFLGNDVEMARELHASTGFLLEAGHEDVACEKCHQDYGRRIPAPWLVERRAAFALVYPGRQPDECKVCHGDPHEGQFQQGEFRDAHCLDCHERHKFKPSLFKLEDHEKTSFPLLGKHRETDCEKCHERPKGADETVSRIFTGTTHDCEDCHEHPHEGQFEEGPFAGRDCKTCHGNDAFKPSIFTLALHDRSRFPLTGAHQAVACYECHKLVEGSKDRRIFSRTSNICGECHEDVHEGAFDRPDLPQEIDGRTSCARCHKGGDSFALLYSDDFDHSRWTEFELRGQHAKLECVKCHEREQDGSRVKLAMKPGESCANCHEDPHAGQFRVENKVDCSRCHVDTRAFTEPDFDHEKDSRFKIDEDHKALACSECHKTYKLEGGQKVVRFRPLGIECADCHGSNIPESKRKKSGIKRPRGGRSR